MSAAQGVLANDSDVDGDTLSVSAVNGVAGSVGQAIAGSNGGTFTLNADGSYSFDPGTAFDRLGAGQTDTTQIGYTVSDGQGGTATSTLTVTVTGTNNAPWQSLTPAGTGENDTLNVAAAQGVRQRQRCRRRHAECQRGQWQRCQCGHRHRRLNGWYLHAERMVPTASIRGTAFAHLAADQQDTTQVSYTVSDGQGGPILPLDRDSDRHQRCASGSAGCGRGHG
nr:cadherin-like domain-containing protein [Salinicola tamaricis]